MSSDDEPAREEAPAVSIKFAAAFVLFLCAVAVLLALGTWQGGKFIDKRPRFQKMETRLDRSPVEIRSASRLEETSVDFRRARLAEGTFDRERSVLIANQFHRGTRGFWVLTPYVFPDDTAVWVQRGWVPDENPRGLVPQTEVPETPFHGLVYPPYDPGELPEAARSELSLDDRLPIFPILDLGYLYESLPNRGPGRAALIVLGEEFAGEWDQNYPIPTDEHVTDPYLTPGKHLIYAVLWFGCAALLAWLFWAGATGRLEPGARH